jgi:hypothetical protein
MSDVVKLVSLEPKSRTVKISRGCCNMMAMNKLGVFLGFVASFRMGHPIRAG